MRIYLADMRYRSQNKHIPYFCAQHSRQMQFAHRHDSQTIRKVYRQLRKTMNPRNARHTIWDLMLVGRNLEFEYVEKEGSEW